MSRLASHNQEANALRLLLAMQLRPSGIQDGLDLAKLARKDAEIKSKEEFEPHKAGELRTVPVTTTTVEGIGNISNVNYGIITFQVTKDGAKMEKRALWGPQGTSGFMIFNE